MQIALLGGTGEIGEALALRLGRDVDCTITIGSRDKQKAVNRAKRYRTELRKRDSNSVISAAKNEYAAATANIVVLAVPPYYVEETVERITPGLDSDTILVSPAVGMREEDGTLHYHPPSTGSVAELVAETAPDSVSTIGAFANLPAERLADLDVSVAADTLLVGDDYNAKEVVADVIDSVSGVRPLDGGQLANAREVEALTPLLINIERNNEGMENVFVSFN